MSLQTGNHAVLFYADDGELVDAIAAHLEHDDAATIVIATAEHRAALAATGSRIDVSLDAAETLARFSSGGKIDREAFYRVIGTLIAEAGAPARVYGEMVGILWDAGSVGAAIELEELWNELGRAYEFDLLCGYRSSSVAAPELAAALERVCGSHSSAARAFAPDPEAPHRVRRFVADTLSAWGHDRGRFDGAQLVVSELATNAVIHARSAFSVRLQNAHDGVRLAVADESPSRPAIPGSPHDDGGRGLKMVDALARRWGVEMSPNGKTVWAELPL